MPQPRRATPAPRTAPAGARPRNPNTAGRPIAAGALLVTAINQPSQQLIQGGAAAQAALTAELAKGSVRMLAGGVALAYRAQSIRRRRMLPPVIEDVYRRARPEATPEEVREAIREELEREMTFRRRQLGRLRRDLRVALTKPTPAERDRAVQGILGRERHYTTLREEALAARAIGAADARNVREVEPDGPVWTLGPRERHTPDCVILHGNAIPWEVLEAERLIPPIHNGCGCRLRPRLEAYFLGHTPIVRAVLSIEDAYALIARARRAAHEPPHGLGRGHLAG